MATSDPAAPAAPLTRSTAELAVGLYSRFEAARDVTRYYGVLAVYALARFAADAGDEQVLQRVEQVLRRFPDGFTHPPYNFPSYRIGGIAQAFLVAAGRMPDRLDLVREYADELITAARDPRGLIRMPNTDAELIWVDAAMATAPFLLFAGTALREDRYVDEAVRQVVLMHDDLLDPTVGLLHQCRGFVAPGVLSADHWSRGNGWWFLAAAELLRGLPADHPGRPDVERRFVDLAEALLRHQTSEGLWRQEIPLPNAWEETSGTGLILYGIGVGVRAGVLAGDRWTAALRTGLLGVASTCVNADFSIENSCPGTLCPGDGEAKGTVESYLTIPVPYRDEPHGCAPLVLAMSVADVAGLSALTLRAAPQGTTYLQGDGPRGGGGGQDG